MTPISFNDQLTAELSSQPTCFVPFDKVFFCIKSRNKLARYDVAECRCTYSIDIFQVKYVRICHHKCMGVHGHKNCLCFCVIFV